MKLNNQNKIKNGFYRLYYIYLSKISFTDLFLYIIALVFYKRYKYEHAKIYFTKMKNLENPNAIFKMGMCFFKQKKWVEAEYYIHKSVQTDYKKSWLIQLYQSRLRVNQTYASDEEKLEYTFVQEFKDKFSSSYADEIKKLILDRNYTQAIKILERQIFLYPLNSEGWFLLGCIYDDFQSYDKSSYYFKNSYDLNSSNRNYQYRYAYALDKNHQTELANQIYEHISFYSEDEVKDYGVGILHIKRGLWEDAIFAFHKYKEKSDHKIYHYLYTAYFFALDYNNAAIFLEKYMGNSEFCNSDDYYRLAKCYFLDENYISAINVYNAYIDRAENLKREQYDEYVTALILGQRIHENKFNYNLHIFPNLNGVVNSKSFVKTQQEKFWNHYIYYTEKLPIRQGYYLLESFAGDTVSCSPYAILLELLAQNHANHTYIVVCNDHNKIPNNLHYYRNIIFVKKNSDLYIRYLATAQYLINNTTFSPYFSRRQGQQYLMTWHGTPIKSLGRDQKNGFMSHANVTRNFLHATQIISPNPHTTQVILNRYDIADLYQGYFYQVGYPRVDLTLKASILSKADLGIEQHIKVVLYAPTWRGTEKLEGEVDVEQLIKDLTALSQHPDLVLFYKSHHLIEKILREYDIPVRSVPENIDTNVFLSIVDCLISDYSSIVFDFLPLNKPIISFIYDYDDYVSQRGELYFDKSQLFGFVCESLSAVNQILNLLVQDQLNVDYTDLIREFCPYDRGDSASIVVDILHGMTALEPLSIEQKPVHLLFCGSFLPNGVTNSFKNLIKAVSTFKECRFALVFDINAVQGKDDNYQSFLEIIDLPIILLGRLGATTNTADEKWLKKKLEIQHDFFNEKTQATIFRSYQRELNRVFGDATFKSVISFDGYSIFWIILLSLFKSSRKIIYMHSNMYDEWKTRFPYLKIVFSMYSHYDQLNSVSEACYHNNLAHLTQKMGIHVKQSYANNIIDHDKILHLATVKPEKSIKEFEDFEGVKFINVARLSVEKDHEKLIRAFDRFQLDIKENVRLYIIGYGPLEESLRQLITSLKLETKVYLLGYQSNPYYYMAKSNLFVFSSNYEGQGLVLLESMILNLPTLTTDIEGVQSVVNGTQILAVDNSIAGLSQGMHDYMLGHVKTTVFDYCGYNQVAIAHFKQLLQLE